MSANLRGSDTGDSSRRPGAFFATLYKGRRKQESAWTIQHGQFRKHGDPSLLKVMDVVAMNIR